MPDFAARLRNYRQVLNISQQSLAEACGISWRDQQAYEYGTLGPNAAYLQALANAGLEVAYLTTGEFPKRCPDGMDRGSFVFLENWKACPPEAQEEIARTLEDSAKRNPGPHPTPAPRPPAQVVSLTAWRRGCGRG